MTEDEKKEDLHPTTGAWQSGPWQPILPRSFSKSQRWEEKKHQRKLQRAIQELKRDHKKKKFAEIKAKRKGLPKIGSKPR